MQRYQDNVVAGLSPIQGASVLVQNYPSGSTATIYSDNGVTQAANPLTTDSLGGFFFYAANGHYQLSITGPNIQPFIKSDVLLSDVLATVGTVNQGGTTAQRPAAPTLNQSYFDTTLGYEIECKQVTPSIIWVNAAGVQV